MSDRHEPREAFVAELESQLLGEFQRGRRAAPTPRWFPQTTRGMAFATAAVVLMSMGIGGGLVSAAYEAQESAQRDLLLGTLAQRQGLASKQLVLARQRVAEVERRLATGLAPMIEVLETRLTVTEAEVELQVIQLDIAEVRASGREPVKTVSAPLVAGRDFVSERWKVESQVPATAHRIAQTSVEAERRRFEVGLASSLDVERAGARLIELEAAVQLAERKIAIRRAFLNRDMTAAVADLRVLEAETEQRRVALAHRIDVSRRQLQDVRRRLEIGTSSRLDLAEAELRLQELQLALTKADYDLALIRKQLGK
jgi:outer membrane protein TolC